MAIIQDIAMLAKVSPATVSRVLNHDMTLSISNVKRARILEIAEDLNYKTPKRRKQERAGVIEERAEISTPIACIMLYSSEQEIDDPYYLAIHHAIKTSAVKRSIKLAEVYYHNMNDLEALPALRAGTLIIGSEGSLDSHLMSFFKKEKNVVCVDFDPEFRHIDAVCADFRKSIQKIAEGFAQKGISRVGYIGGKEISSIKGRDIPDPRTLEFREALRPLGIFHEGLFRAEGSYTPENAYKLTLELFSSKEQPQGLFVASDNMALGVYKALTELGLSIPNDVAIVSCNDQPVSGYMNPPLSTIRIPRTIMGAVALSLIISRIYDGRDLGIKAMIPTEIIYRESFR